MRTFLLAFALGFILSPAYSQTNQPDLIVQTHGPIVRHKAIPFSVSITEKVKDLAGLTFTLENGYMPIIQIQKPNFNTATAATLVGPINQDTFFPGELLKGSSPVIGSPIATGPKVGSSLALVVEGNGDRVNIGFAPSVSGPGEITTSNFYIYEAQKQFFNTPFVGKTSAPVLKEITGNDSAGKTLKLTAKIEPTDYDLRLYGDLNGDGLLTTADAILILRSAIGLNTLSEGQRWYADVQPTSLNGLFMQNDRYLGDGRVTVLDAIRVLEVITGKYKGWWPDQR